MDNDKGSADGLDAEDDDDTSYNCELCRDSGRIELTDGHYQYIGDGTASCPRCYGGILRT